MGFWALSIAVSIPVAIAAVLAYLLHWRALFWGGVVGAVIGLMLRPMETARYDDPRDELIARAKLAVQGTIPCSIGGSLIGCIATHRKRRIQQRPSAGDPPVTR